MIQSRLRAWEAQLTERAATEASVMARHGVTASGGHAEGNKRGEDGRVHEHAGFVLSLFVCFPFRFGSSVFDHLL